jgi:hypothetical protein
MSKVTKLKIGDVTLALIPAASNCGFRLEDAQRGFITDDPPDVNLHVHCGRLPDLALGRKVFDSGDVWILYRDERSKWVVSFHSPVLGTAPYQLAIFEDDFCTGDIYVGADEPAHQPGPFTFEFLLGQILMIHLLSRGRGVLLHACGLSYDGRGTIFVGVSGAGKSTLANLWRGQKGATLLSDDRVIVREKEGGFWTYGTPWHGDARAASPETAPLERIFIIHHAVENEALRLAPADAASRLLARSFPTFWDAPGMAFTLEFLAKLTQAVPCYQLGFVPDASLVDFVRCIP